MLGTHRAKLGNITISLMPSSSALRSTPAADMGSTPGVSVMPFSAGQPAPGPSGSG